MPQAKTETIKVTMKDGRVLDWPTKRKMQTELVIGEAVGVRIDWVNGETGFYPVPQQHKDMSAANGYRHKLTSKAGGLKDDTTGNAAEPEDQKLAIEELHERLIGSADWNVDAIGGSATGGSIILQALMEDSKKPLAVVKKYIKDTLDTAAARGEKLSRQGLYESLRATKRLRPIIQRLEDEKAAAAAQKATGSLDDSLSALAASG